MKRISYRIWELEVDYDATRKVYDTVEKGGSQTCTCVNCIKYRNIINDIFPQEVLKLFDELGIDYNKDAEVTHTSLDNGYNFCHGWFHFIGKLLVKSDKVRTSETGFVLDMKDVVDNFKLGFHCASNLSFFDGSNQLVQVEFSSIVKWE